MSLLALRSSHRGVRLHTFEPEDRAYTSTPTKIGGHCLDHIRNGLTVTWRRSLNSKSTTTTDIRCTTTASTTSRHVPRDDSRSVNTHRGKRSTGSAGEVPAAYSTTLDPSMGRFGGLGAVVLKLRSQRRTDLPPRTGALTASPLYPILDDRPPDTLASPGVAFPAIDAVPRGQQQQRRRQQQEEQQHRQAYGPEWPAVAVESEVTDLTVAPHGLGSNRPSSMSAAQRRRDPGASPHRSITTAATGHSGALMAILLSKLANSGGSDGRRDGGDLNAAGGGTDCHEADPSAQGGHSSSSCRSGDGVSFDLSQAEPDTATLLPMEALRHSVDGVARGLDDVPVGSTNASAVLAGGLGSGGAGGGSWAWKARVEQTPRYSKLRRYDFVRELGSGSHGTVLLVRKRCPGGGGGGGRGGISSADVVGGRHRALTSRRGSSRNSGDFAGSSSSRSGQAGSLRVLKESQFLPEAVNEARLLLLAGGGGGGGSGSASRCDKPEAGAAASESTARRASLADAPGSEPQVAGADAVRTGADVGVSGSSGVTATGRDDGDRRGEERGEVVQLHDFFVETVGHRSLAFLELEYCEGGDLRDLILAARATPSPVASGAPRWKDEGGGEGGGGAQAPAGSAGSRTRQAASGRGAETTASAGARNVVGDEATYSPAQQQSEEAGVGVPLGGGRDGGDGGGSFGSAHGGLDAGQRLLGGDGGSPTSRGDADAGGGGVGLPAAQIGRVALGLCEGLQRLHERGVLHRDLKPANVLLTKTGAVRVADLGVSTSLDPSRPLTENAAGTIPFMAPEVRKYLLGSKIAYSGKADVWAVGALVYAMAVGNPAPEELATLPRSQLVSAVGNQTRSEALSLVAHRALNPDPSRRPSVHQMTSMLQALCEREGWLSPRSPSRQHGMVVPMARL